MRSAICISGLGRTYQKTVDRFYTNLYEPLRRLGTVDVFVSMWDGHIGTRPEHQGNELVVVEDIKRLYRPLSIEIESYRQMSHLFEWPRYTSRACGVYTEDHVFLPMLMQYKVWRANELKRDHEQIARQPYDLVVRTRFDWELLNPLSTCRIDTSRIGVLVQESERLCYYFYLGGSAVMDRFCSTFFNYGRFFETESDLSAEHLLWKHSREQVLDTYVLEGLSYASVRDNIRHEWHWDTAKGSHVGINVNTII